MGLGSGLWDVVRLLIEHFDGFVFAARLHWKKRIYCGHEKIEERSLSYLFWNRLLFCFRNHQEGLLNDSQ